MRLVISDAPAGLHAAITAVTRLVGAVLADQHDEWAIARPLSESG